MRVAVSGHRGLPPGVEAFVSAGMATELLRLGDDGAGLSGISCLADGADQLFARAVLDARGVLEAVIPADDFRDRLPDRARSEFDVLLSRASSVFRMAHRFATPDAYMDASRFMIDRADHLIAVWDGQPARSFGGTADVVSYARAKGVPVVVIWPAGLRRD